MWRLEVQIRRRRANIKQNSDGSALFGAVIHKLCGFEPLLDYRPNIGHGFAVFARALRIG